MNVDFALIVNRSILALIGLSIVILLYFKLTYKSDRSEKIKKAENKYTIPAMIEYLKSALNEMTSSSLTDLGLSEEEYTRRTNQRIQLIKSLKDCTHGDLNAKNFLKWTFYDLFLKTYDLNEENINKVIPFNDSKSLTSQDKFDILIYQYKKKHGLNALTKLIQDEELDVLKPSGDPENPSYSYIITPEEINKAYKNLKKPLHFEDKLNIIVQRLYQSFKGFSVVDEIRDMKIDGVSGGVSGVPLNQLEYDDDALYFADQINSNRTPLSHDSVWIFFKGKSIHLSFLSFGTEAELKRVCQNIYRYNNPGQLSEANGYKVNEMKDGSRIVVVRPNFSESWAFFVRKFDTQAANLEQLINKNIKGRELLILLLSYLVKGGRILALTGSQGSGKTTMLMALIEYIDPTFTLRVQEMAFELHLRKIFKNRNILSFRETDTVTGQAGLDVQKKTDGTVNILGEVATDPVAAWMIQMAQVASLFTIFTHHAKKFDDLVHSLRNSLLKEGIFHDEKTAEEQVVRVLNFDVHLKREKDGTRYIERITECIYLEQDDNYPDDIKGAMKTFFKKMTNRKVFTEKNIIEYQNGEYVLCHSISQKNTTEMLEMMSAKDQTDFQQFIAENWGEEAHVIN